MKLIHSILIVTMLSWPLASESQTIPYNLVPDWVSTAGGHIATGLGLADINGDGWKDLVVANGNDIQRQRLVVYYNQGDGTFPLVPDWQSDDIDYHGHLSCGDIDQDGDIDIAVSVYIGAGGFGTPGKVKVYYNMGESLETSPSFVSNPFYTFSCALGDADGDGDLDLATTAGEPYGDILDYGKIFINDNGTFQAEAEWQSDNLMGSLDVEFGDINRDGYMDVIFVCENTDNYIFTGLASGGISMEASWQSSEPESFINSVDIGYRGEDECLVVMTENSQLGGQGKVRSYIFTDPLPASSSADWYSNPFGYGSGIALADIDLDADLDLVYGGWWLPVNIALWTPIGFELSPSYTSSTNSVVEAIQLADLGRESMSVTIDTLIIAEAMAGRHVLILPDQIIEEIIDISRNGNTVYQDEYCMVPNKPWISFEQPFTAGDVFILHYNQSPHPDMVITNWDSGKGNYIFYNTNPPVGIKEELSNEVLISLYPNPATNNINLVFSGNSMPGEVTIMDLSGRMHQSIAVPGHARQFQLDISSLSRGIYFLKIGNTAAKFIK